MAARLEPGGRLLSARALAGGVSARVDVLEIALPDSKVWKVLVRRHGEADRRQNPQVAAHEFRLLRSLQAAGVAAPKPLLEDASGTLFPQPYIVVEYVEGAPDFAPADLDAYLGQFAAQLARIHTVDPGQFDLSFLPDQSAALGRKLAQRPAALDEALDEGRLRAVLSAAWPLPPANPPALLHGDYWPGNLVWQAGRLAAVIDWEDAALGDPLSDIANARLELLWVFGVEAMQAFTERYLALAPIDMDNLPYWDLAAALRPAGKLATWGLEAAVEQKMRDGHKAFVRQALRELRLPS